MIAVRDVSVEFAGKPVFQDVSFVINHREKVGLIGRNGTGKSTFLKLLLGRIQPTEGSVKIPDGYLVGCVEQHFHYVMPTVMEEVCSVLNEEREYETWKGAAILSGLGFTDEQMEQDPKTFSGGFQVKINLAKALLLESNLLLLDEPTNYLDIYSIRWLRDFLKKWPSELILITHDRSFMDSIITHSLIIHRRNFRKVVGKATKVKEQIALEEEIYEKTRINEAKERDRTEEWIRKFGSKASMASRAKSMEKALEKRGVKDKLEYIPTLDFRFTHTPYGTKDHMIVVNNLSFGYSDDKPLVKDLSFTLSDSDKVCIIGRNGNGKSTLLKLIAGNLQPTSGSVKMHEKVKYGYFGQMNIERLNNDLSVREEIATSNPNLMEQTVRKVCSDMLFSGDSVHKKISVLSGGEKSRVMLGKILLNPSNMLLLDEPTNHFDMESSESLMDALKEFPGVVMMVTHDESFLYEIATKLIVFDDGKTFCFNGTYEKFLKEIGWKD